MSSAARSPVSSSTRTPYCSPTESQFKLSGGPGGDKDPDPLHKKSETTFLLLKIKQCCVSITFWCGSGSGSADPCLSPMDPDPDPAIFVIDLQDANKKLI